MPVVFLCGALLQVERFRRLAGVVRQSLLQLQAAIKGLVVMSAELEAAYNALLLNQVCMCAHMRCTTLVRARLCSHACVPGVVVNAAVVSY